ncbi:MAG TPA: His/Gly/Thr/Pro-type tRNA ligase C-terminal domain-containing protein [Clostridiaceae bacterium]|jgi:proline--tRNA ligase|nr:His/Gly/Thr/Pro-type tRNA ligase C-terminal domain-containing protein [Clostridiaceae bacterium]
MRVSKMGMKNVKLSNLDEMYPVQDILLQTNQVKQYGSGVYAYDNVPLKVQDNIEEIIKRNFNKADFIEVQMPLLQQDELWKRSGRYDKYIEEGVMMLSETDKGTYCLAPTAEEAITTFVENRITSHKQLPVGFYQIGPKFRNEIRNRGYLLRGREFLMFDLYTFDKDEIGMMESYKKIRETYFKAFNEIGLDIVAVAADNGSMGGKNSEEIMAISTIGEDTILFDEETKQGLNVEVLEKDNAEEYLKENYGINDVKKLKEKKACELGHIFALGTKYTESMNINFIDNENNSKPFYMGCYGIGVSRVLGLIYENNAIKENDKVVGVSLPLSVTPYYLYIISNDKKKESAEELYSKFNDKDIEVIIDDVKGSIGEKIRNAKVLGIPYIAIMGNNTEDGYVEIERTRDGAKKTVKVDELLDLVEKMKKEKKDIEF